MFGADAGLTGGCGSKVFLFTVCLAADILGICFGASLVRGTVASFLGETGFVAAAAPVGFGVAEIASFFLSSGLSAW